MAAELMKSLVFDKSSMVWDKSRGFIKREMPLPVLDETGDPHDADNVLVKVIYAGFCGSDRGIWNRTGHGPAPGSATPPRTSSPPKATSSAAPVTSVASARPISAART